MENFKIGDLLYEGKAKKVFQTSDPDRLIQVFKDDATAFNAQKRGTIKDKGIINNAVSEHLFRHLENHGIDTHFIERLDERAMLIWKLDMFKIEVVVRNLATGSLVRRLRIPEGQAFSNPIVEYYYKNDELGDPLLNDDHIRMMGLAGDEQLRAMKKISLRVNEILSSFFEQRGMILVDFKLEYGLAKDNVILGDEICPDTCRFWDKKTGESMDKDRFRKDLGNIEEAYQEVYRRVCQPS
jgi:phosphoribosylaminoimidazole-succinocarboxamide synthase